MTATWFVTRKPDGSLASIHRDHMEGYNDEALADDNAEIAGFLSASATKPSPPSPREWIARLSPAKQVAISGAALASPDLFLWVTKLLGATFVDVTDPETITGVNSVAAAMPTIITPDDVALLLAP